MTAIHCKWICWSRLTVAQKAGSFTAPERLVIGTTWRVQRNEPKLMHTQKSHKVVCITLHFSLQRHDNAVCTERPLKLSRDKDHSFDFAMFPIIVIKMLCQINFKQRNDGVFCILNHFKQPKQFQTGFDYWTRACNFYKFDHVSEVFIANNALNSFEYWKKIWFVIFRYIKIPSPNSMHNAAELSWKHAC